MKITSVTCYLCRAENPDGYEAGASIIRIETDEGLSGHGEALMGLFCGEVAAASVLVGAIVLGLKTLAWWVTGSVALLSDALESFVNLAGAVFALAMVTVAARPALFDAVKPLPRCPMLGSWKPQPVSADGDAYTMR